LRRFASRLELPHSVAVEREECVGAKRATFKGNDPVGEVAADVELCDTGFGSAPVYNHVVGSPGRIRTIGQPINSRMLYR
jgi:hypothetical protein